MDVHYAAVAMIAVPVLGIVWMIVHVTREGDRGDRALKLAKSNPEIIKRVELTDGDPVLLTITLKGKKPASVYGLTPIESVRLFDELKSAVNTNAEFVISNPARRTA